MADTTKTGRKPVTRECDGHPAGPDDPMGETVYCDGSCRRVRARRATRTLDEARFDDAMRCPLRIDAHIRTRCTRVAGHRGSCE